MLDISGLIEDLCDGDNYTKYEYAKWGRDLITVEAYSAYAVLKLVPLTINAE